jgi:hypothetical protein
LDQKALRSKKRDFYLFCRGPGGTSHSSSFIEFADWNIVYIDQRGSACSRPATVEQSLDGAYYSSEAIARDADLVREKLGLKKWSIFGTLMELFLQLFMLICFHRRHRPWFLRVQFLRAIQSFGTPHIDCGGSRSFMINWPGSSKNCTRNINPSNWKFKNFFRDCELDDVFRC